MAWKARRPWRKEKRKNHRCVFFCKNVHTPDRLVARSSAVDPSLPLGYVVQNLYSTDPTQETCPIVDHAGDTAPTRQCDELDYTEYTRSGTDDISALKYLDHEVWESVVRPRLRKVHDHQTPRMSVNRSLPRTFCGTLNCVPCPPSTLHSKPTGSAELNTFMVNASDCVAPKVVRKRRDELDAGGLAESTRAYLV